MTFKPDSTVERIVWETYPSWRQFTWLYLFSGLTAFRGVVFWKFGLPGVAMWLGGAVFLLGCAVAIRRWVKYRVTSTRVVIQNGYTGREMDTIDLKDIREMTINQGPIARFMGIETLVIQGIHPERRVQFRGISDAEVVRSRIDALKPSIMDNAIGHS